MKTTRVLFTILFLTVLFISCEVDKVEDQIGIDNAEVIGEDEEGGQVLPE